MPETENSAFISHHGTWNKISMLANVKELNGDGRGEQRDLGEKVGSGEGGTGKKDAGEE